MVAVSTQNKQFMTHNFVFEGFKLDRITAPFFGKPWFWNLQSFLILKHYLSIEVSACKKSF